MRRYRILDLFAGAGGCAVGYHRAGFDMVGVDNKAHDVAHAQEVMGIDWMTEWSDLADAIPPAYTELIGLHLHRHLDNVRQCEMENEWSQQCLRSARTGSDYCLEHEEPA